MNLNYPIVERGITLNGKNQSTVGSNLEGLGGTHTQNLLEYLPPPPSGCQVPVPSPTLLHFTSATLFRDLGMAIFLDTLF